MNADLVVQWAGVIVPLIVLVAQGLFVWFLWSLGKKFVAKADCEACHSKVDAQLVGTDARLSGMEGAMKTIPAPKDIQDLLVRLAELSGDLRASCARTDGLSNQINGLSRQVAMLTEHHVGQGR
ncbi:DUF2730 family protein [Nitratidesulfovibrio liaohensis]|uniref:DUF2730 family protein n=1 Tax=Nitratidesulfovibrio liaohensis TaxID=2604158 RepID=UPI001420E8E6|nr:DUF2730 family protein [Nitratidesulfovibrio liaohensis]NHZ48602.1 DUF2730 family protein [Nitratidesulfovibrio liaohensis]